MWGFLSGTLALVVLQTLFQPAAADKVASGTGAIGSILSRMLSANVAGLPQTKAAKNAAKAVAAGSSSGGVNLFDTNPATGLPYYLGNTKLPTGPAPGGPAGSPGPGAGGRPA